MPKETAQSPNIAIVDSDESVAHLMRAILEHHGFMVDATVIEQIVDHPDPASILFSRNPQLIIFELSKGAGGLLSLFNKLIGSQRIRPNFPRLLLTSTSPDMVRHIAGGREIINRPFDLDHFVASVQRQIRHFRRHR